MTFHIPSANYSSNTTTTKTSSSLSSPRHTTSMPSTADLPAELVSSWSMQWRMTPPHTTKPLPTQTRSVSEATRYYATPTKQESRAHTTLPPIESFVPLTPPWQGQSPLATRLPPLHVPTQSQPYPPQSYTNSALVSQPPSAPPSPPPRSQETDPALAWFDAAATAASDWLRPGPTTTSASFIAEKMCEMICYVWFSTETDASAPSHPPSTAQLVPSPTFILFTQKLLETTQLSQSVIVLSLHYIHVLKGKNTWTPPQPGSEFRIAVAGLMMANKFLDDNTYTNKTWSEVSGISLKEINRMEREFLNGVSFSLYANKHAYAKWLILLKGLVLSKERQMRAKFHRKAGGSRAPRAAAAAHQAGTSPLAKTYSRSGGGRTRARSTSPLQWNKRTQPPTTDYMTTHLSNASQNLRPSVSTRPSNTAFEFPHSTAMAGVDSNAHVGAKRSAAAAFSPTVSPTPAQPPAKRPLSMYIPETTEAIVHSQNPSPLDGLHDFGEMSLGSNSTSSSPQKDYKSWTLRPAPPPETLVQSYEYSDRQGGSKDLYFYTLACSPSSPPPAVNPVPSYSPHMDAMDIDQDSTQGGQKKSRLRFHSTNTSTYGPVAHAKPQAPTSQVTDTLPKSQTLRPHLPYPPIHAHSFVNYGTRGYIQSANASPSEIRMELELKAPIPQRLISQFSVPDLLSPRHAQQKPKTTLPSFHDAFWNIEHSKTGLGPDMKPVLAPIQTMPTKASNSYSLGAAAISHAYASHTPAYASRQPQQRTPEHDGRNGRASFAPFANAGPPGVQSHASLGYPTPTSTIATASRGRSALTGPGVNQGVSPVRRW